MSDKSIVGILLDGSKRLDDMSAEITKILGILHPCLEKVRQSHCTREGKILGHSPFDLQVTHKSKQLQPGVDKDRLVNYQWEVFINKHHQVVIKCFQINTMYNLDDSEVEMLLCVNGRLANLPPKRELQEVRNTLDGFVREVFAKYPNIPYQLAPLLDAGQ